VLDGLMPKKDGFSVSREAKDLDPQAYQPKVILMTAVYKKYQYQIESKKKHGVDEYLVKPFDISILINHVHKFVERRK
jgi:DNA-binding response OmpR family regulator